MTNPPVFDRLSVALYTEKELTAPMKKPFVTLERLQEIVREHPTPFHLYDARS